MAVMQSLNNKTDTGPFFPSPVGRVLVLHASHHQLPAVHLQLNHADRDDTMLGQQVHLTLGDRVPVQHITVQGKTVKLFKAR